MKLLHFLMGLFLESSLSTRAVIRSASVAYAASYSESSTNTSDVFFTNATETTAKSDFTVNGVRGRYRTLSNDEWVYVFTKHGKNLANPSASSQTLNNKHYQYIRSRISSKVYGCLLSFYRPKEKNLY